MKQMKDPTKEMTQNTSNLVTGTIDRAIDKTAEITTNSTVRERVNRWFQFLQNRQWKSSFRLPFLFLFCFVLFFC